MTHPSRSIGQRQTAAFSLLEMVLSMAVLSIALVGVGSVFILANKVMPAPGSAEAASVSQSAALSRLVEDLQVARYITESSANAVTLVVDDRTGDGLPDRLRYAWSGSAGDPLTYAINDSAPVTVAEDIRAFALGFTTEDRVDTVPGGDAATGGEALLYTYDTPFAWEVRELSDTGDRIGAGQFVLPTLPAGVASYAVTRVRISARRKGPVNGETYIRLYNTDGALPTGTALAEEVLLESSLPAAFEWIDIPFANPVTRLAGESFAVSLEWKNDAHSAGIQFDDARGEGYLTQNKPTDPWVNHGGKNLMIEVYGTCSLVSPDIEMTREVRTHTQVTLQVGDSTAQQISTRLYREPGVHSAVWDAGFDASPAGVDLAGDGPDWAIDNGGAAGSFANGVWTVDGRINIEPAYAFLDPVVVDVVMGCTTNGQNGAKFGINADRDGGLVARLVLQAGLDATGSHYVQLRNNPNTMVRLEATDLGPNLPRVRLLISPADDTVGLIVNGQPVGTYIYERESDASITFSALVAEFSDGVIDDVSIRIGGTAVVTANTDPGDAGAVPAGSPAGSSNNSSQGTGGGLLNNLFNW